MQTADNVARWFLSRNNLKLVSGEAEYISNLKLQKLLYYAQGLYAGAFGKPLFHAPIVAWQYGPVVESVYQKYKANGARGIEDFELPKENFTPDEEAALNFTQNNFGQFSAWKLMEMTHEEEPWLKTERNAEIPLPLIVDYFKEHYVRKME